jgi:hypothetical protein
MFRYDTITYAVSDFDFLNRNRIEIILNEYQIIKHTKCGVWIDLYGRKKFINTNAVKQYAYDTKHKAMVSFKKRKQKQCKILENQLANAKQALFLAMDERNYPNEK